MTEKKLPVFQEGDRVIGTDVFDGNEDIVGMTGTIRLVEGDGMYSVEYDDKIEGGHDCGGLIPHGYGWHTHANSLAPYQDEPVIDGSSSMSYDEVMI